MYRIEQGTYNKAKQLGVEVKPAQNKFKKIDIFKNGEHIAVAGARGMMDYYKYLKRDGPKVANERRLLYLQRHEKDRHIVGSNGYYAAKLLWNS